MFFNSMELAHLIISKMPKDPKTPRPKDLMGLLSKIEPTPGC
jgi:hypothetical protein